jgi:spermidine synthase
VSTESLSQSDSLSTSRRFLPLVAVLFLGSGCSALIYEIVWFQSLQLVIGSSAVSLGVLLGTFMGGMCFGSLVLPRVVSARRHPLRVYALLELGIGLAGIAILLGMPYVDRLYVTYVQPGLASILMRAGLCAICLLPPTALMGATLPAVARWVQATPQGVAWLGFFYGSNIAGAVFGCLLAGFYLLRVHDGAIATYVAAALNLAVAALALLLARRTVHETVVGPTNAHMTRGLRTHPTDRAAHATVGWGLTPRVDPIDGHITRGLRTHPTNRTAHGAAQSGPQTDDERQMTDGDLVANPPFSVLHHHSAGAGIVYMVIALSGLTALGAEVIWTRILSLLLGGTVYTFSIILAVFLVGLGLGSSIGSVISRHSLRPRAALGLCQLLLMGAIAWAAYVLAKSLPYWPIDPSLSWSPWLNFQLDLVRCAWAVLPGAILWGASFPLALAAVACGVRGSHVGWASAHADDSRTRGMEPHGLKPILQLRTSSEPGRLVGGVYAANTVGAILGSLGFSMVLIPWLGTRGSQRVMIGLAGANVLLLLVAALGTGQGGGRKRRLRLTPGQQAGPWPAWVGLALVPLVAVPLAWSVPGLPAGLIAYGRHLAAQNTVAEAIYTGEGMNSTIAVTLLDNDVVSFHVCGKVEASTEPADMRLQRMLGHLSALMHPQPRSVLVVGCGAGVTAGTFVLHPDVERIVLCEIEPLIPQVAAGFFSNENYGVLHDPRVQVVYDDARHYILTTHEKFDVITSDPVHPWIKGSAALYTKEYFELCRQHLNPGGVITQWVPLYESSPAVVKSEMATFFSVFPHGTVWSNDISGAGYDVVLLGREEPLRIEVDQLQQRLERADHLDVAASLAEVEFDSALELLATYAGQGPDLRDWLREAQINTDRTLRLQYLAGMGLNAYQGSAIYDQILSYRKFPEDLFHAAPQRKLQLRAVLSKSPSAR